MRNSYETVSTERLIAADYNPNVLDDNDAIALVDEIRRQGRVLKPVVVRNGANGQHIVIDGHWNWVAAREAGISEVPVELVEADEFEARRQTLIRYRTGRKDNIKLGRVYADMLAAAASAIASSAKSCQ